MSGPVQPTYYRMKTVEEYEASGVHVKSKETRKYIFTFLDDISRVSCLEKLQTKPLGGSKAEQPP